MSAAWSTEDEVDYIRNGIGTGMITPLPRRDMLAGYLIGIRNRTDWRASKFTRIDRDTVIREAEKALAKAIEDELGADVRA